MTNRQDGTNTDVRHIRMEPTDRGALVVVDDYELFDYVDDFLSGQGLDYEYTYEESRDGKRFYLMQFDSRVSPEQVLAAIEMIPSTELQRIWSLNNHV